MRGRISGTGLLSSFDRNWGSSWAVSCRIFINFNAFLKAGFLWNLHCRTAYFRERMFLYFLLRIGIFPCGNYMIFSAWRTPIVCWSGGVTGCGAFGHDWCVFSMALFPCRYLCRIKRFAVFFLILIGVSSTFSNMPYFQGHVSWRILFPYCNFAEGFSRFHWVLLFYFHFLWHLGDTYFFSVNLRFSDSTMSCHPSGPLRRTTCVRSDPCFQSFTGMTNQGYFYFSGRLALM